VLSKGKFIVKFSKSLSKAKIMDNKENIIETFTELAPRYEEVVNAELDRFWGWSYTGFIHQLIQSTPIPERGRMLDLATGTAVIPITVTTERGGRSATESCRIHGLDITMSMLERAKKKIAASNMQGRMDFVCASAMDIPYASGSFDLVTCALATHHMDSSMLLAEAGRILRTEGIFSIADVGGSRLWKTPLVKFFLRIFAFVYFLFQENINRAWAEAEAVSNVRSEEEWFELLVEAGFRNIKITKLQSRYRWVPEPLVIQATKTNTGGRE